MTLGGDYANPSFVVDQRNWCTIPEDIFAAFLHCLCFHYGDGQQTDSFNCTGAQYTIQNLDEDKAIKLPFDSLRNKHLDRMP